MFRLISFLAVLMVATSSSPARAATWEFEREGDAEGWRVGADALSGGGNATELTVKDGVLRLPVPRDPRIGVHIVSPHLDADATLFDRVIVRVRISEGTLDGFLGMKWKTDAMPANPFAVAVDDPVMTRPIHAIWGEDWQEIVCAKFTEAKTWEGTLVRFSLSFGFGRIGLRLTPEDLPEEVWVDSITLTGIGEEALGSPIEPRRQTATGDVFEPYIPYKVGALLPRMAGADLDGDGDVDIIRAGGVLPFLDAPMAEGQMIALFNAGDGSFPEARTYNTGAGWLGPICPVDLDEDGDVDLAMANTGQDEVLVFRNLGDRRLADPERYEISSPGYVWAGDVDEDGDPDLAVSCRQTKTVAILLNEGDGTFHTPASYTVQGSPGAMYGADLNRDGEMDLVGISLVVSAVERYLGEDAPDEVFVLLGTGEGRFGEARSYPVGHGPSRLATGDFDEDGDEDVAVSNWLSDEVWVLLNEGDGRFSEGTPYAMGDEPGTLCAGDFDEDGHLDLAVADRSNVEVLLLVGSGDGTFSLEGIYPVSGWPFDILACDLDGDGHLDLAVCDNSGGNVCVLMNRLGGRATSVQDRKFPISPDAYTLHPNFPNPFNAHTTIRYDLQSPAAVNLCIYDITGQHVKSLVNRAQMPGGHSVVWDGTDELGRNAGTGVYVYRLSAFGPERASVRRFGKLLLVR